MRWSDSVLTALVAMLAGASFGYLMPHSAAGKEKGRWMPLGFEKGMEVFLGTSRAFFPYEPRFVREGDCKLSGRVKWFRPASDDPGQARLGYGVDFTAPPTTSGDRHAAGPMWSPYNVQLCFTMLDADGFRLHTVRTAVQRLDPAQSCSLRDIVRQPIPGGVARRTEKIECRLCFE
ncbi:MAG: hypothetical protein JW955_15170, partial [Sedimentisphaerales bacterium]|nr:hypothetical protein [Sedimentisphaerales bacterium]